MLIKFLFSLVVAFTPSIAFAARHNDGLFLPLMCLCGLFSLLGMFGIKKPEDIFGVLLVLPVMITAIVFVVKNFDITWLGIIVAGYCLYNYICKKA